MSEYEPCDWPLVGEWLAMEARQVLALGIFAHGAKSWTGFARSLYSAVIAHRISMEISDEFWECPGWWQSVIDRLYLWDLPVIEDVWI